MGDYIGALVKRFESGSRGSLALSSCGNDWGLSCGSYQLTLRWGNCVRFLKEYFPDKARKLYFNNKGDIVTPNWPGKDYCSSPADVKLVWKECYNAVGADKFFEFEHDRIQKNYYDGIMKMLDGFFNPNNHSRAMQECMWSWAVHRGVGGAYKEFRDACQAAGIKDPQNVPASKLIDVLYDKRYSVSTFRRYQKGAGADSEREVLRAYCNTAPLPYKGVNNAGTGAADGVSGTATSTVVKQESLPWYRVGTNWANGKCVGQTGAYHDVNIAKKNCKPGQNVYDEAGKVIYSGTTQAPVQFVPYIVRITASELNVRKGPGTDYGTVTKVHKNELYTIVDTVVVGNETWGKLKSGVGYIALSFTVKK